MALGPRARWRPFLFLSSSLSILASSHLCLFPDCPFSSQSRVSYLFHSLCRSCWPDPGARPPSSCSQQSRQPRQPRQPRCGPPWNSLSTTTTIRERPGPVSKLFDVLFTLGGALGRMEPAQDASPLLFAVVSDPRRTSFGREEKVGSCNLSSSDSSSCVPARIKSGLVWIPQKNPRPISTNPIRS